MDPLRFSSFALDLDAHEITRDGTPVDIEPQVFDVLAYLVSNRDRLVTKDELLDKVWGSRFVTESALTSRIKSARRALGDTGRAQRIIRTIYGRGYRFVAAEPPLGGVDADLPNDPVTLSHRILSRLDGGGGGAWQVVAPGASERTRFAEQLHDLAGREGVLVGRGSAVGTGMRAFGCVVDALDEILQRQDGLQDRLPVGVRQEIARVVSGELPTTRQRIFVAAREALVVSGAIRPTLLILEALEFADIETLELVDHVGRLPGNHPIGVVVISAVPLSGLQALRLHVLDVAPAAPRSTGATPPELVRPMQAVALGGPGFDLAEFEAATGFDPLTCGRILDVVLRENLIERVTESSFRFVDEAVVGELSSKLPAHERIRTHRETARRLIEANVSPGRPLRHLLLAGDYQAAMPLGIAEASRASDAQLHKEVLRITEALLGHASGDDRFQLLSLRANSMFATGDPAAIALFREALVLAPPDQAPSLRATIARSAIVSGDLDTAADVLSGLEPDGGPGDGLVLLAKGMLAYFTGDLDAAQLAADRARDLALSPGTANRLLDVITLQGMIAHNRGEWFNRLKVELRAAHGTPALANTIFDCHLCVAEYLLYGPMPYGEVVALATDLRDAAEAVGAIRAVAFSWCVTGEAEYLAGHLEEAREHLRRAVSLHRELGADTGTAHSLQRLAEVELAFGNRALAERLAREALPLARWSPLSRHLIQRTYGTLIHAAPGREEALAVVDEAAEALDDPTACMFCLVIAAVPSAIACAEGGRLDDARRHLMQAEMSAGHWQGTAWSGAVAEARAVLARAQGDPGADGQFERAAILFDQAGQPLDAARCREAAAE